MGEPRTPAIKVEGASLGSHTRDMKPPGQVRGGRVWRKKDKSGEGQGHEGRAGMMTDLVTLTD